MSVPISNRNRLLLLFYLFTCDLESPTSLSQVFGVHCANGSAIRPTLKPLGVRVSRTLTVKHTTILVIKLCSDREEETFFMSISA